MRIRIVETGADGRMRRRFLTVDSEADAVRGPRAVTIDIVDRGGVIIRRLWPKPTTEPEEGVAP